MTWRPFLPAERPDDVTHLWRDDGQGGGQILSAQDVAPILEANRARANDAPQHARSEPMRSVAFIPNIVRQKWLNEEGWDAYRPDLYGDKLRQKLNDPDWSYLRTSSGRV